MTRQEFLRRVQMASGLSSMRQADEAVKAVVSVLKAELPPAYAHMIASVLPEDLRLGWEIIEAYPADILEREDIFYEGFIPEAEKEAPTITQG